MQLLNFKLASPLSKYSAITCLSLILFFASSILFLTNNSFAQQSRADQNIPNIFSDIPITANGLTSEKVANLALLVSADVDSATLNLQTSKSNVKNNLRNFAPIFSYRFHYTRLSEFDQPNQTVEVQTALPLDRYGFNFGLNVPLSDYFLVTLPNYKASQIETEIARYELNTMRQSIALKARLAFYHFIKAYATNLIAKDALTLMQSHYQNIQALTQAGQTTRADLLRAQAELSQSQARLASTEGALYVSTESLRLILKMKSQEKIQIGENIFQDLNASIPNEASVLEQALAIRPDIKSLKEIIKMQSQIADSIRATYYPKLNMLYNLDVAKPNPRSAFQTNRFDLSWDLSLVLSWSTANLANADNQIRLAQLKSRQAENALHNLIDEISLQVSQIISDLKISEQNIKSAKIAVMASEESWQVRQDLLTVGRATSNEVLDAENILRLSQSTLIDAYIAQRIAFANLLFLIAQGDSN